MTILQEVRYAARALRRSPGFTVVAVATLALGIGVNAAFFSVVRGVLLRPLPYKDAGRLMAAGVSLPDFADIRDSNRVFDGMAVFASNLYNLSLDGGEPEQALGAVVSRDFFPLLGNPRLGRVFRPDEARLPLAVVSDRFWRTKLAGSPSALGRTITLGGKPFTVIGVMPPGFEYPTSAFELWVPLEEAMAKVPGQGQNRSLRIFRAVAHVAPGVTPAQAAAEVFSISQRLQTQFPSTNSGVEITFRPIRDALLGRVRPILLVLLASAALVLLVACANVANLTLTRAAGREREIAIRAALGAGRWRLARQVLVECLLLSAAGGVLGLAGALSLVQAFPSFAPASMPRVSGVHVDTAVLLFSFAATFATAILFGLAPAIESSRAALAGRLQEGGRGTAGSRRARRVRHGLVIAEVALSVVVLVAAGLLARSLGRLLSVDLGFEPSRLLTFNVELAGLESPELRAEAAQRVIERLSRLPGVAAAGGGTGIPPETAQRGIDFAVAGRSGASGAPGENRAYFVAVTPDYFRALGTRVLDGRVFSGRDRKGSPLVVLVSRGLASRLFPNGSAVGQRLKLVNPEQSEDWREIVGVVDNIRYSGLDDSGSASIYTPFSQTPFLWTYAMLRTSVPPESLYGAVRESVRKEGLIAARLRPMEAIVSGSVAQPRFQALLLSAFAGLALVLASVGIYGVVSYGVSQRRREIGVRMALGASPSDVLKLIGGQGMRLVAAGLVVGVFGAFAAGRFLRGLLFEIGVSDPLTFASIALLLTAVGLLASWLPARRALRLDPIAALRSE